MKKIIMIAGMTILQKSETNCDQYAEMMSLNLILFFLQNFDDNMLKICFSI